MNLRGLKCPACGYDGSVKPEHDEVTRPFMAVESWPMYYTIRSVSPGGVIDADPDDVLGRESYGEVRLECRNCLEEFPLPAGWSINWEGPSD